MILLEVYSQISKSKKIKGEENRKGELQINKTKKRKMKGQRVTVTDVESQNVVLAEVVYVHEQSVNIRRGFVRKVFGILTVQLAVTFLICLGFGLNTSVQTYVTTNAWPFWLSFVSAMACYIAFACSPPEKVNRHPFNIFALSLITIFFGIFLGCVSAQYTLQSVYIAAAITCGVSLGLMLFACQTTIDLTGKGLYLFGFFWTLFLIGICLPMQSFESEGFSIVLSSLWVLCFAMYIVYDTQLILGGEKRHRQFSIDSYVYAALNLYIDIINMFLLVLGMGGNRR